jgi:hypothetical protein
MSKVYGIAEKDVSALSKLLRTPTSVKGALQNRLMTSNRFDESFPFGKLYAFGLSLGADDGSVIICLANGSLRCTDSDKPTFIVEEQYHLESSVVSTTGKCGIAVFYRRDTKKIGFSKLPAKDETIGTVYYMSDDGNGVYVQSSVEVAWENVRSIYSIYYEDGQVTDVLRHDDSIVNYELFTLRASSDESGTATIQVYAPKARVLFYDQLADYFADATLTWDDADEWATLPFGTGEVYAYVETDEAGVIVANAVVKFSQTEVIEKAICIYIGEIALGQATNQFKGAYSLGSVPIAIPFSIIKKDDAYLIYIPMGSLIINDEDWSQSITGLTKGVSPIVGDWYTYTEGSNWLVLSFLYNSGEAYGHVTDVSYLASAGSSGTTSYRISNGTSPVMYGKQILDLVRLDSGDSDAKYKSLAVQGTTLGISEADADHTIELHGFKDKTALLGTLDGTDIIYSHKMPVREEEIATGKAVLRWADVPSGTSFDYPWRCDLIPNPAPGGEGVNVTIGRVYKYLSYPANTSVGQADKIFPFAEIPAYQPSVTPGGLYPPIGFNENDYIVLCTQPNVYPAQWEVAQESYVNNGNLPGWHIVQRLCRMYKDGAEFKIEQIHMGDVTLVDTTVAPFTVASMEGSNIMYLPANSVVINGTDYTSSILSYGPGTSPSTYTDWYYVGSGLVNLYIYMKDTADGYGTVNTIELNDSNVYPKAGELITIPIWDQTLKRSFVCGAINRDIIRTDAHANQYTDMMKSISNVTADRTFQLRNFKQNTSNASALDGTGAYDYTLVVREVDGSNNAEVKYVPWSTLQSAIESEITEQVGLIGWDTVFGTYWETWYEGTFPYGKFWEQGVDETINFGSAIGSDASTIVINLANRSLENGPWYANCDFLPATDNAYVLGSTSFHWSSARIKQVYMDTVYDTNGLMVVSTRQSAIADATGGAFIDVEARAAINALLAIARPTGHGLIENNP